MTPGILVLEGADAAGKTTLANHLREHHGARYLHLGPYADVWRWHLGAFLRAERLAAEGHLVVVDRHWLSECSYGAVYRGGSKYPVAARCLDRLWRRAAALYVMCVPSDLEAQVARRRTTVKARGNVFSTDASRDVTRIVAYYADLMCGQVGHPGRSYLDQWVRFGDWAQRPDVTRYDLDVDGEDLEAWTRTTLRHLRHHREVQFPMGLTPFRQNYAGHPAGARFLLVGEEVSARAHPRGRWPFVDRDQRLSAATWLNDALHRLAVRETDLVWTNARPAEELELLLPWATANRITPVALGRVAERELDRLGYAGIRSAPHPQWARRFKYGQDYAEHLRPILRGD